METQILDYEWSAEIWELVKQSQNILQIRVSLSLFQTQTSIKKFFNSFRNLCNLFLMPHEMFSSSLSLPQKAIQAQLIDIDLLLTTEKKRKGLKKGIFVNVCDTHRAGSIECISESSWICDNAADQIRSRDHALSCIIIAKEISKCAISWSLIKEISLLVETFLPTFSFLKGQKCCALRNVQNLSCLQPQREFKAFVQLHKRSKNEHKFFLWQTYLFWLWNFRLMTSKLVGKLFYSSLRKMYDRMHTNVHTKEHFSEGQQKHLSMPCLGTSSKSSWIHWLFCGSKYHNSQLSSGIKNQLKKPLSGRWSLAFLWSTIAFFFSLLLYLFRSKNNLIRW